jgi:hypothetical protein
VTVVRLEDRHVDFADTLANRRHAAAVRRNRPASNGAPTDNRKALGIHILGARAECASYLYLSPVKWNAYAENLDDLADLDDFIDAKGIDKPGLRLTIQRHKNPSWAFLLVLADPHPYYRMVGWEWGREVMIPSNWSDPSKKTGRSRPAYFVAPRRDASELRDILRDRQNRRLLSNE